MIQSRLRIVNLHPPWILTAGFYTEDGLCIMYYTVNILLPPECLRSVQVWSGGVGAQENFGHFQADVCHPAAACGRRGIMQRLAQGRLGWLDAWLVGPRRGGGITALRR